MNMCSNIIGATAIFSAGALALPGTAADIVNELQGQGYDVQLNGQPNGALAQCTVTAVHQTSWPGTAYVDLDCPGND